MGFTSENKPEKQITMGILAHVDAGKTTLSEGILYTCKAIRKLGRVDHQDAFLGAPERTETKSGFLRSPNFLPLISSIFLTPSIA